MANPKFNSMRMRCDFSARMTLVALSLLALLVAALSSAAPGTARSGDGSDEGRPTVMVAPIEGTIDPVAKDFVDLAIRRAIDEDVDALVFRMDTPGGLSTSMSSIIKRIVNEEELAIVVYVTPRGSRAASAGAIIAMASDVAAMAPSTSIGSATPIQGSGDDIKGDLRKKIIADAVSQVRGLARENGRDADEAEKMVTEAENYEETEALEKNLIEFVSSDIDGLLDDVDGFETKAKGITLDTKGAEVIELEVPFHLDVLKYIIDPNVLFLLFTVGLLGLGFEITHPGTIFPGVVGGISLILALYGFQVLPTNAAGVVLITLAVIMMVAEAFVMSHGVLGAGGVIALVLGGLLLFDQETGLSVDLPLLVIVALVMAAFFGLVVHKAMQVRHRKPLTAQEEIVGECGIVRRELVPRGLIFIMGELWSAEAPPGEVIVPGEEVVVDGIEGLLLFVSRADAPNAHPGVAQLDAEAAP